VNKAELLKQVEANRNLHGVIFKEAMVGYRKEATRQLKRRLDDMEQAKLPKSVAFSLYAPADHTKDYDNAIAMIRMAVGETMEIDEAGFNQFVMDDWQWKQAWVNVSNQYSATSRATYGVEDDA
jgi:hypothetical protein